MHKQHPQTAYRKYAGLIGTIFENCDRSSQPPCYLAGRLACCLRNDRLAQCSASSKTLVCSTLAASIRPWCRPAPAVPAHHRKRRPVPWPSWAWGCQGSAGERACFSYRPAHCTMRWTAPILPDKSGKLLISIKYLWYQCCKNRVTVVIFTTCPTNRNKIQKI